MINATRVVLMTLHDRLCNTLEQEDGSTQFFRDNWQEAMGEGSGLVQGLSCVMEAGPVIEKAGVNFSYVQGKSLPNAATRSRADLKDCAFEAVGLSVVVHPRNPFVPTTHANLRLFVANNPEDTTSKPLWWFGGGFDLTPYYGFDEDCQDWHHAAKTACDPFGPSVYPTYKQACDSYFFLKHRNEQRGIGGLFFDDLNNWGFKKCLAFIQSVGEQFIAVYSRILSRRKHTPYTPEQREFQCYRRGRYVEFNLLYDRGTAFGLESGGRTESILMSMPPNVLWRYGWTPTPGTPEAKLYDYFLKPREWV